MPKRRSFRIEHDSLGEFKVPADAWYGIQTARAVANFPISGRGPDRDFVIAHLRVKRAAAAVNRSLGVLDARRARAILAACDRLLAGEFADQFVVDRFQAGAGTSHNMNANEVIANLANASLGGRRGIYRPVHPNDHVNASQSTNDTIPTALRLAALAKLPRLLAALEAAVRELSALARRERNTVKSGRTHLQDAVPTTLGREFAAWAFTLRRCAARLRDCRGPLRELGLGGTAVGTGLNAPRGYARAAAAELRNLTGEPVKPAADLAAQMQSMLDLQALSSAVHDAALELLRISNDIRLLASGPRTGIGELVPPAVQPGSSIMPGKVNPVMFEMLGMVCLQVVGQHSAVSAMTAAGQLELNVMMPALGSALFDAMDWLTNGVEAVTAQGLKGLRADRARAREFLHRSAGLATLFNSRIGYDAAAKLAQESVRTGRSIREVAIERGLVTGKEFDSIMLKAAHPGRPFR